jgi:hypothetical protein
MTITRRWTPAEIERLKMLRSQRVSAFRAAAALKRNIKSVQRQARLLGTPFPTLRATRKASQSSHSDEGRSSLSTRMQAQKLALHPEQAK